MPVLAVALPSLQLGFNRVTFARRIALYFAGSYRYGVQGVHLNPLDLFLTPWASSYAPPYRFYGVF